MHSIGSPAHAAPVDELTQALLDVSLAGLILYRPIYAPDDPTQLVDLAFVRLNPVAQRLLQRPECPPNTFLTLYPHAASTGAFAFQRDVFLSGQPGTYQVNYQHDGLDNYYQLAARRSGDLLLVSFDDTSTQERSTVEQALRMSQAEQQIAYAEVERQRIQLYDVFEQAPAMICLFEGPQHTFQFVNPPYQTLMGDRPIVGKPIAEAMPELAGQPFFGLLDRVYQTGETFRANEMLVQLDHDNRGGGHLESRYYNFIYQARRSPAGVIDGIFVFAYEVTSLVLAREEVQVLNEELAVTNEELRATNDEFQATNLSLHATQQQLLELNQELEVRVQERTQQARQARAEAERERRQFENILLRAPASICIFDGPDWVYSFVNPGYQRMFPGRQLLGLRLVDALPEVADQPLMQILHRVYDTGETFEGKEVLVPLARTDDGPVEDIYFDLTYQARYNEAGQIDGFITYAYDVTEQVLARRQREAQQRHLQQVFAQAPVAICVFQGPTYVLELVNPLMGEMLGHAPNDLLGQPFFTALPELINQGLPELLAQVRQTGTPYRAYEQPIHLARHQPGEVGYFHFVYEPLRDAHGQLTGVVCVATEVTEQVQARQRVQDLNEELAAINEELAATNEELTATNEELNESNAQLTRTNVDLDNFVYAASHDLKAPISNIEGLLVALDHELPTEARVGDVAQILHLMQDAAERFNRTIANLTDITRLQKAYEQHPSDVSLREVVQGVRLDLEPLLTQTQGKLVVDVPAGITLHFSEKNLRSVIYNLVSNALKYRHPERHPQVLIRWEPQPDYHVLHVQDNGLGLDLAQDQAKLFTMFERLHTHVEGSGIGLYMVKKMVENAGGRLDVQSQLGQGSTFTVYFPR